MWCVIIRACEYHGTAVNGESRTMPVDDYLNCPVCGMDVPASIEGGEVRFCPFCGEELDIANVFENGLEEPEA